MCGRTCLTLEPKDVLCACKYNPTKTNNSSLDDSHVKQGNKTEFSKLNQDLITPEWRSEFNCGRKYIPSYNIAPTDITPVLVSTQHFVDESVPDKVQEQSRIVVPMMWGMIPFWHKGDYRKHGLTTNNCRLEHMLESKLYRGPFRRGQRCVILCEGFYEWQTTKSAKPSERAAYLLYQPQKSNIAIHDKSTWSPSNVNLLKMAGLFDMWDDENGDKMFSYSVITFESTKILNWLHHRMPAILETEQQVNDWLDFKRVSDEEALSALRPATQLKWHRVSNLVNNSRNKSDQCNKPIEIVKSAKSGVTEMSNKMLAWLNVRKRREQDLVHKTESDDEEIESSDNDVENAAKRPRYRDYKKAKETETKSTE